MATRVFLDINCTPLEELVDEIVPGGGEAITMRKLVLWSRMKKPMLPLNLQVQHALMRDKDL
jgi:hypothetical protein